MGKINPSGWAVTLFTFVKALGLLLGAKTQWCQSQTNLSFYPTSTAMRGMTSRSKSNFVKSQLLSEGAIISSGYRKGLREITDANHGALFPAHSRHSTTVGVLLPLLILLLLSPLVLIVTKGNFTTWKEKWTFCLFVQNMQEAMDLARALTNT